MTERIPWGKNDSLEFELPAGWKLLGRMSPAGIPPVASVGAELENALRNPAGSPPLAEIARGKKKVVIVVDDISRPTPAHLFMGGILEHLAAAGVPLNEVTIVPGLGLHRAMTREDMEIKVGGENLEKVKWENPDCNSPGTLAYLGKTKRGTPVRVNKTVADAELVVLVGTIEPHPHAGFGGGFKNILPGVAGVDTISRNHAICAHPKYFHMLGTDPETNPMRQDLEEAGRMLNGDKFIVNTVLNSRAEIVRIVAGDPVAAHREGAKTAQQVFGVKVPKQADVVITDSHPMDIDIRQSVKAVANTLFAAKPGGIIIAALKCDEGLGNMKVPYLKLPALPAPVTRTLLRLLAFAISKIAPPGISPEERFSAYFLLKALLRNKLFIYAPSIVEQVDGIFPSIKMFRSFDDALRAAEAVHPGADVLIFPHGGAIYPML